MLNLMLLSMCLWIVENSAYNNCTIPKVAIVSEEVVSNLVNGNTTVKALYNKELNTVILPNTWKPYTIYGQSKLLHELVHHTQTVNKKYFACVLDEESEAYSMQVKWAKEKGLDLFAEGKIHPLAIRTCPRR